MTKSKAEESSTPLGIDREKSTASSRSTAGRELDALIAKKVFGLVRCTDCDYFECYSSDARYHGSVLAHYSTDIATAWAVVVEVQRQHPGWRFSLLGGDEQWGYTRFGDDTYAVDKTRRGVFGWGARFFGSEDPTIPTPMSWGESHGEDTPSLAICLAALRALDA